MSYLPKMERKKSHLIPAVALLRFAAARVRLIHFTTSNYFGHTIVDQNKVKIKIQLTSVTCLTAIALRLKSINNLTTEFSINRQKKFKWREGASDVDNFEAVHQFPEKNHKNPKKDKKYGDLLTNFHIRQSFITPLSFQSSSYYEKMVGSVKRMSQRTHRQILTVEEQHHKFFCEAEGNAIMHLLT